MKLLITLGLALLTFAGLAQDKTVFYFKYNGNKVATADSADFIRVITPPDSASTLFNVQEFYTANGGKRKLIGKSTAIDPIVLEGQCATYYLNGNRESVTDYSGGTYLGNSYIYYPNGKLHTLLTYDTLNAKNYDVNYKIITCNDSTGAPTVTEGNGHYIDYNLLTRTVSEEGNVKNGSPDGEWHGSYADKVFYVDTYRDGQFISGISTLPNGVKYTYQHKVQSPEFKGGDALFMAYLKKKVNYKAPVVKKGAPAPAKKIVLMTFVVTQQGKPVNVKLFGSFNSIADKALMNAALTSTGWKPALQNGHPVDAPYNLAVNL
jgi:antitoxin component YwqK of YwqJK toxin-antitoxin module